MSTTYNSYNEGGPTTGNYNAKIKANDGLSVNRQTTEAFQHTILGIGDKYDIDLYGSMMTWHAEDTPLLTLLYNIGTESAAPPYIVWNDEYRGQSWYDIGLDEMRLFDLKFTGGGQTTLPHSGYGAVIDNDDFAVSSTDSSYKGGTFEFGGTIADAALGSITCNPTIVDVNIAKKTTYTTLLGGAVCFPIALIDGNNQGRAVNVYNRLRQLLYNLDYVESSASSRTMLKFNPTNAQAPAFFAFDDVYLADDEGLVSHKSEVLIRIEAVILDTSTSTSRVYIFLNSAQSNHSLTAYTSLLSYMNHAYEINLGTVQDPEVLKPFDGCISHPSRMVQLGEPTTAPLPIPEGDNFVIGGGMTQHRERVENYSQIFASKKYGITGTTQASKFRFGDDFAATREFHLNLYKKSKVAAYLMGMKGESTAKSTTNHDQTVSHNASIVAGQPVRTLGGMLDYALFPLTYMKKPLTPVNWSATPSEVTMQLSNWLSELSNSLLAFRQGGSKNLTFLVSQKFLDKLDNYVRLTFNSPWMGGQIQLEKPSQLTFGLEIYTFKTSRGHQVNFVHEPALDWMIEFPTVYHQFGKGFVDPKDVMLSIDTNNIRQVICRPDRIHGNIQDQGQDAFLEGMRGESSFKLRFPKNHAIIWVPDEA